VPLTRQKWFLTVQISKNTVNSHENTPEKNAERCEFFPAGAREKLQSELSGMQRIIYLIPGLARS